MRFSLIICTYMRPKAILKLAKSVQSQTLYPNEILIIDGSTDDETEQILKQHTFNNLVYHKVDDQHRGLTKQRNFGISKVSPTSEVVCFLDDDTILHADYFKQLLSTYDQYPNALGVGGYINNEVQWQNTDGSSSSKRFYYDGWMRKEPLRFRVRKWFGLAPDTPPCYLPSFSHGRSVSFLPPSGKVYPVEQFMGGVSSYRTSVFDALHFSTYFEGYGLYEDTDFCLRLAKKGELYVNTAARLEHHHDQQGRPNKYKYGKMVIRNGWYIWKVKYPKPNLKAQIKWHLTAILLLKLTFLGVITNKKKSEAFNEGFGRFVGWLSLIIDRPKIER
ncbi:glycosyltransferase family 2 protein [Gelidibacter gilvus]|uniref:Glycosyltransferase n=1 Tax=Gelidibacter gilvus TaxID=59602 RepID=A0A4Q0XBX4_9FLAO|nr:glycosyltransferase [Gelidibacter gilvus]RXJ45411.1 glycosyltransferase [Gelidibacter gilvus]